MKQYRVTVNGQAYDVLVEEVVTAEPVKSNSATLSSPQTTILAPTAAPSTPPAASKPASIASGYTTIVAPMPGAILSVSAKVGQTVQAGKVLLILEAMKMENEISSPATGTVREVSVSQGTTVNTGDILVVIE